MRRVAFLRGLNVGGHRVKMDRLRALFEEMGFEGVETLLASGNVVFDGTTGDPAELEARIARGLAEGLGYEVPAFVRTLDEVAALLDEGPVSPDELDGPDHAHYVLFLAGAPGAEERAAFADLDSERDSFRVHGREVHWLSRGKLSESPLFGGEFERATRSIPNTMRNANTLRRLVERFRSSSR